MNRFGGSLPLALAVLIAVGCASSPTPAGPEGSSVLVGAWRSAVQFKSGAFAGIEDLEFMYVFNSGGTLTESSNYDGAPPVPPAYGVWRSVGADEFEARYEYYATRPPARPEELTGGGGWLPSGRGVFVERIKVAADGRSFVSAIRYRALDPAGNPLEGGGEAEGRGVRIGF
jgi:hypothetical protein